MLKLPVYALVFLLPVNAAAFVLHTTTDDKYLKWHRGEIVITLDDSLEKLGPLEEVEDVITGAFDLWLDKSDIPLMFAFEHGNCAAHVRTSQSCIMACRDKATCYEREGEKGASTFLHFLPTDGRITGVSIVFNAADWQWSTQSAPEAGAVETEPSPHVTLNSENGPRQDGVPAATRHLDLERVTLHEVGHLLGIDHSENPDAIMYYSVAANDRRAPRLHNDDIDAAAALYSTNDIATIEDAEIYSGCLSVVVGKSPAGSIGTVVGIMLLLCLSFLVRPGTRRAASGHSRKGLQNTPRRSNRPHHAQRTRQHSP